MHTKTLKWRKFRLHPVLLACASACLASSSHAFSLGSVTNPIYIGKPFLASVPLNDSEGVTGCISAQLNYGDIAVDNVTVQRKTNAVLIRSTRPVDEPIVNLTVTADCNAPITRSYALFAEMPSIVADGNQNTSASRTEKTYTDAPSSSLNFFDLPSSLDTNDNLGNATPSTHVAPTKRKKLNPDLNPTSQAIAAQPRQKPESNSRASREALTPSENLLGTSSSHPRLELDNNDWIEQAPQLHFDNALHSTVSTDQNIREEARMRWMALSQQMAGNATATTDRLRAIDAEEKNAEFQATIEHNEQQIKLLQTQLNEEKKAALVLRSILLGILGLALLSLGGLLIGRWRTRKTYRTNTSTTTDTPWWQHNTSDTSKSSDDSVPIKKTVATNLTGYLEELPVPEVDFSTDAYSDFAALDTIPATSAIEPRLNKKPISTGIEGLQSVQEQADFFAALGQFDQAEELLRRFIGENPATSPLAYLSLLSLYYNAQNHQAFDALREHYNHTFNAQVPNFDAFKTDQRGLESYPETIAQIQQLWGTSDVIRLLEDFLFKVSKTQGESTFAPLAYRELLLLYGIATETMASPEDISRMRAAAADTKRWLQPTEVPAPNVAAPKPESVDFNTGPIPLDHDLDHLSTDTPPENMNLDLDLNGLGDIEVDLRLPDTPATAESSEQSNSIDFDLESSDFRSTETLESDIDFSLDELEKPLTPRKH